MQLGHADLDRVCRPARGPAVIRAAIALALRPLLCAVGVYIDHHAARLLRDDTEED